MNLKRNRIWLAVCAIFTGLALLASGGEVRADFNDLLVDKGLTAALGQPADTGDGFTESYWTENTDVVITRDGDLAVPAGVSNFFSVQQADVNGGAGIVLKNTNGAGARRAQERNCGPLTGTTIWFSAMVSLTGPGSELHLLFNTNGNLMGGAAGFGVIMGDNDKPGCLGIVRNGNAFVTGGTTPDNADFLFVDDGGGGVQTQVIPTDGTSHVLLGRIDVSPGAGATDTLSIWLDPADALAPGVATLVDSTLDIIDSAGLTSVSIEVVRRAAPPAVAPYDSGALAAIDDVRISDESGGQGFVTGNLIIVDPDLVESGSLDPDYNFGLLDEDSTNSPVYPVTRSRTFENIGATQPITITGVAITGDDDGVFSVTTTPAIGGGLVLDPTDNFDVDVTFDNPAGMGSFGGIVEITTSVPTEDMSFNVSATYISTGDKVISNGTFENEDYDTFWTVNAGVPFGPLAPGSATAIKTTGNNMQQDFVPAVGDDWEISFYFAVEDVTAGAGNRNFNMVLNKGTGGSNYINLGHFPHGASPTLTESGFYIYDGVAGSWSPVITNNGNPPDDPTTPGTQATVMNSLDNTVPADNDYDDPGDGDVKNVYFMRIVGADYGDIFYNYDIYLYDAAGNLLGFTKEITEFQNGDPSTGQPGRLIFSTQYGNNPGFVVDDVCVVANEDDGSGFPLPTDPDLQVAIEPDFGGVILDPVGTTSSNLVIRNSDSGETPTNLNVSAVNFSDSTHFSLNGALPGPIAPGGTATLQIDFTPGMDSGTFPCTISIDSDDSLNSTETVETMATAWNTGDVVNANCDFEATPFDDGWTNTGAIQVSELDGTGGSQAAFVVPGGAMLAQDVIIGGDWEFECQFAVQASDPANRTFALIMTSSNAGATGAATIGIRYGEGYDGFSVYGGGWQPVPSLGTLLPSEDIEPDGVLDTANIYQLKVIGRDWGENNGTASYDILLTEANGTTYTRAVTDLTWVQNGDPETDVINGFRFDTVYGTNPGFMVDDACLKAGSAAADDPNLIVVTEPGWADLTNAGAVSSDLVLENTGTAALLEITSIGDIAITGADAANFSVDPGTSFPVQIGAGTQGTIPIIFEQGASPGGTFTATLEITSNDTTDAALGITRDIDLSVTSFNTADKMLTNWDFEATPFDTDWNTVGSDVLQFGGLNTTGGSTQSAFLSAASNRLFQAPAIGLESFEIEFYFALTSISGRTLNFRVFGNAGATGDAILTMKYDNAAGGGGGKALQVYDGAAWQNVISGLSLSPSLDFNGDNLLDTGIEPNDIRNVYRLKLTGNGFGTVDANYTVAILQEDGTPIGSAGNQTIWRADATTNQAWAVEFNTNGAAPFWVDDVCHTLEETVAGTDYDVWAAANGLTGDDALPGSDPDGDGLDNETERAFGLDPNDGASVSPVSVPLDKTAGTFTYTRRDPALSGLTYTYHWSTTLDATWTAFTPVTPDVVTPIGGTDNEEVVVNMTGVAGDPLSNDKLFVRVQAN